MTPQDAYKELKERLHEIAILGSCEAVLGWEERTYMPRGGAKLRSEQVSLLAGMLHERFTDPKIGELIAAVEGTDIVADADSIDAANIRELRHDYDKETKLPKELVEEKAKVTSLAQGEWVTARAKRDFKLFLPWLEKVVAIAKREAECFGYEGEPYNALLDRYEPGAKTEEVAGVFAELRKDLVELNKKIQNAPKKPDESIIERTYKADLQAIFGEMVASAQGFDFNQGRLDVTTHPFCSGFGPGDTRITTRYNPHRLNDALFGIMHECGHALYEMGIPKEGNFGMPISESTSLGIHESQSRMWENQVGRSKDFWVYFFPQLQRIFRSAVGDVSLDDFYGAINCVKPSYIRVEADEATYNLHIMLRFELERALMKGEIKPADIAGEWNKRFKEYFGIEVDHDANGCLQDVHWSAGLIGYFPTYALGNLYSAQFFAKAKADIPGLHEQFQRGDLSGLLKWLRTNIHQHGRRYRAKDLVVKVTGEKLSHKPLMDYMTKKYSEIYGI
ncbi:MAG: carboxypeptidase M32 [candidate division Zixibacteria bacterium]|nr:carboxypeptidase M32 [candidate division Zixibacteria bacterium]